MYKIKINNYIYIVMQTKLAIPSAIHADMSINHCRHDINIVLYYLCI